MQEVFQNGTMGETYVENTIEDLVPHIKKSLENQNVAYVKIFRGIKTSCITNKKEKKFVAIDEMKEKKAAEIIEDFLPETIPDPKTKATLKIPRKK